MELPPCPVCGISSDLVILIPDLRWRMSAEGWRSGESYVILTYRPTRTPYKTADTYLLLWVSAGWASPTHLPWSPGLKYPVRI